MEEDNNRTFIPYNETTKHIYETFAKVMWEISESRAAETDAAQEQMYE